MSKSPIPGDRPMYTRAAAVATAVGIPKRLLLEDAAAGRLPVPVRIAVFGRSGIAHVHTADAQALLAALNSPKG